MSENGDAPRFVLAFHFGGIMGDFPHRELDVYRLAMRAVALVVRITNLIPPRDSWLAKQLRRSVGSMVLNNGEGCGIEAKRNRARARDRARERP
jgi:hypothetical protein